MNRWGFLLAALMLASPAWGEDKTPAETAAALAANSRRTHVADLEHIADGDAKLLRLRISTVLADLRQTPAYAKVAADVAAKEATLKEARAGADPQRKLTASSAFTKARAVLSKIESDAVAADARVTQARDTADRSAAEVETARQGAKVADAADARAKAAADRTEAERQRDAAATEVTIAKLRATGQRYVGQRVKLAGVVFSRADNRWVENIPGVWTKRKGQAVTYIEADPRGVVGTATLKQAPLGFRNPEDWVGFAVTSPDGRDSFRFLFGVATTVLGEQITALTAEQPVTIYGEVFAMDDEGVYGVVCDKIIAGPVPPPTKLDGR